MSLQVPTPIPDDPDELRTLVYQLQDKIDNTHDRMDSMGIPRDYPHLTHLKRRLTPAGRLQVLRELIPDLEDQIKLAIAEYKSP